MKKVKLIKNKCEIETCTVSDPNLLQWHHIIERTEINTTNNPFNLALLCSNCHLLTHSGKIRIIGVYPGTRPPNGRILVYELDGKKNVEGIDEPYVKFENKSYKIFGEKE